MNLLSVMIYAVEVLSNLNTAAWFFLGGGIVFTCLMVFLRLIYSEHKTDVEPGSTTDATISTLRRWRKTSMWIVVAATVVLVFVPNRQTAIMIAASEVAEIVIKSDEAQTVMKDVSGLGADAVNLLKTYIQTEQKKLLESTKPVENKKVENDIKT